MNDYERNADVSKTLNDKWKKGELPEGWYYVKGNRAEGIYAYTAEYLNNMYRPRNGEKIIEQVPSYQEYIAMKKLVSSKIDTRNNQDMLLAENTKLKEYERIVTSYNMKPIDYDLSCRVVTRLLDEKKRLRQENKELKEQLKECELWFTGVVGNMNDKNVGEHNRNLPIGNFENIFKVFSQKINQALGEE